MVGGWMYHAHDIFTQSPFFIPHFKKGDNLDLSLCDHYMSAGLFNHPPPPVRFFSIYPHSRLKEF